MADFETPIAQSFAAMTKDKQQAILSTWAAEVSHWLLRAKAYVQQQEELKIKLSQTKALDSIKSVSEMLKNRRLARTSLLNQAVLLDGYKLLNHIGETIRAEQILYSITVTKTGEALSKVSTGSQVYTLTVPFQEFIKLLNFSTQRITMKAPTAIFKMATNYLHGDIKKQSDIYIEEWSDEKLSNYYIFAQQVRSYTAWKKVNEGNILEAFLRFLNSGFQAEFNASHEYWRNGVFAAMQNTMMSPDPFFAGGDLNNFQIKGLNASVTNLTTLILTMEKVLSLLVQLPDTQTVLKKYLRKNLINEQLNKDLNKNRDTVLENLLQMFQSNIDRTIKI